jgi:nucleotide-binding universal stress UspA family protein
MKIMICTDGSSGSVQSGELVARFRFPSDTMITVLGVSEHQNDSAKLNAAMNLIDKALGKKYKLDRIIRRGNPIDEIISEALETPCDLVAVGGGGGQMGLLHPKLGSTTSKLARRLHTHFLVTRYVPEKISKVLICAGEEAPLNLTMRLGGKWLSNTSAEIGLLHVLPKSTEPLGRSTITDRESKDSASLMSETRDTLLTRASQQLQDAGIKNPIATKVRHGLVVDEVIKELTDGEYELLVVGAHYQPGQDRWQETLLDDITDQLLNRSACSVLII